MSLSLQEQLLKAKLVSEKQAKEMKKQQRKEKKQKPKGQVETNEVKLRAQQNISDKAKRAKLLNQEKNALADKKAILAQIKQLIELNKITCPGGEIAHQFVVENNIKKIFVDNLLQTRIIKGLIAIVKHDSSYAMVPSAVAEKIAQRDESLIVVQNEVSTSEDDDDDPYADYQIPDDLTW